MKAFIHTRYGPPSTLAVQDVAKPVAGPGEVLVKVHATTVNDWDWVMLRVRPSLLRLMMGLLRPRTAILGAEVAGTVEATGAGVTQFSTDDPVFGDISEAGFGGFAEYVAVKEDALYLMPPAMTFEQAVALPHAGALAWQGLVDIGAIQPRESVLINGAGGGVGSLGLQIAKSFGCEVTGVDSADKLEALTAQGFDHVLDYRETDFTSGERRYDLVLDARTTRSPWRYQRALNPNGRYVTVGGSLSKLLELACLAPILNRLGNRRLAIVALKTNQGLQHITERFEAGALRCVIDGPYDFQDIPRALQRFGEAAHVGKIVIKVGEHHHETKDQPDNTGR